ncbi:MAG: DUF2490 domain-containing protein [Bacteroidota bacterium]
MLISTSAASQEKSSVTQHTLWNRLTIAMPLQKHSFGVLIENRQYLDRWRHHIFLSELNHKIKLGNKVTVGTHWSYLFFTVPHDPFAEEDELLHELRPAQSISAPLLTKKHFKIFARLMLEERFFNAKDDSEVYQGYDFTYWRVRKKIGLKKSITPSIDFYLSEEFMIQSRKGGAFVFDQNRVDLFVRSKITKNVSLDLGYLFWYQHRNEIIYSRNSIRTGIFISL